MKWVVVVLALVLAGCGRSPIQQAADLADEAQAEAERANGRTGDLESEVEQLRAEVEDLEAEVALLSANLDSQMTVERANRAADFRSLNAAIADLESAKHRHY